MKFNIGDKVSFLDEKGGGIITKIVDENIVTVEIEDGFECFNGNTNTADKCNEICGNGITINPEEGKCDDGNKISGDGCNMFCEVEYGWECEGGSPTSKDVCTEICGNGRNNGGVECDDGNN